MPCAENHADLDSGSLMVDSPRSSSSPYDHPHYEACRILDAAEVKFCVWAEDALSAHGVPTVVFDLYLITENVAAAAQILIQKGFIAKPLEDDIMPIPELHERYGPPGPENERDTVLLAASDWNYDLRNTTIGWLPPIENLVDSLMWRWTNQSSENLRMRLAVYLGYCLLYVDGVKTLDFAAKLRKENRQLHFDLVDGSAAEDLATIKCQEHYRAVREQIRRGDLDPVGPSGICLFPNSTELRRMWLEECSSIGAGKSGLDDGVESGTWSDSHETPSA